MTYWALAKWKAALIAVSSKCIPSKKGLDDEVLGELNAIVSLANAGNKLTEGYQVPIDEVLTSRAKQETWQHIEIEEKSTD